MLFFIPSSRHLEKGEKISPSSVFSYGIPKRWKRLSHKCSLRENFYLLLRALNLHRLSEVLGDVHTTHLSGALVPLRTFRRLDR